MSFPTLVYRCPGTHSRPGGTYAFQPVEDKAALEAALSDGWALSLPEAVEGSKPKPVTATDPKPETEAPAEDAAPTRDELEQKCKELGIKFDGRSGDKKLAALIAEALKG